MWEDKFSQIFANFHLKYTLCCEKQHEKMHKQKPADL